MDDAGNKPQQSFGNGAQRNSHPRPFFYVQPPSQPYHLYQHWGLNNHYQHYGIHGGGYNLARPCMFPYQYMQYPGFVFPHTSLYPLDRRVFEPRFHAPPCGDPPRSHGQQQPPQPHGRRETTCSEAQTDPSDAIAKLIECLDKIRATERQQGTTRDRELDSGVASQSSGMFSPEEKKTDMKSGVLPPTHHLETPVVDYTNANGAAYKSSPLALSPERCWTTALEEDPPIDTSSIHEDIPELEQSPDEDFINLDTEVVTDIRSNIPVTKLSVPKCDVDESAQSLFFSPSQRAPPEAKSCDKVSNVDFPAGPFDETKSDCGYQILKLPLDSILTPGSAGATCIPPSAGPYYYNYLSMQTTHERMSVLSPSLDELSSRDEMFSTDLDDMDIFPKRVYTGRRLPESIDGHSRNGGEETEQAWLPGSKRSMCVCCGKRLLKATSRAKSLNSRMYRDDSEEENRYGRGCEQPVRVVTKKHAHTRKPHGVPVRHTAKPWHKRAQYKELPDRANEEQGHVIKPEVAEGGPAEQESSELQCRTCQDRHCTDDLTTSDQSRRTDCDSVHRKQAGTLQRQEMSNRWKVMYHRPRDEDHDDDEHWERASLLREQRFMEEATCTLQQSYGLGPRGPDQETGPAPGPSGAPRPQQQPERPQQQKRSKPFFYVQPQQPYVPMQSLQWPLPVHMPMSFNPYFGYPSVGFSVPVMPHYQPNPYAEPPSFVVPHTHLHLMDYRRMLSPQYYQSMAYHSRRFHYKHNPQPREMTTSQVQTEPLVTPRSRDGPGSSQVSSPDVVGAHGAPSSELSSLSSVKEAGSSGSAAAASSGTPPSTGGFTIQTEEVRIECRHTPAGLRLLRACETSEVSRDFAEDATECSSILQRHVLQEDQAKQALQVCPDILMDGKLGEKTPAAVEELSSVDSVAESFGLISDEAAGNEVETPAGEKDEGPAPNELNLKVVHLPFDANYLDELKKMESSVWSNKDTLIASPEPEIQNASRDSHDETLIPAAEAETLTFSGEAVTEGAPDSPRQEDEGNRVSSLEALGDEMMAGMDPSVGGSDDARVAEDRETAEVAPGSNLPVMADRSQDGEDSKVQDHQDTSFESLPAYLPSTGWFSDFDSIYVCSKVPQAPVKRYRPESSSGLDVPDRRRKQEVDHKDPPNVQKLKDRYKARGKADHWSLSDQEYRIGSSVNENNAYVSKRHQLCSRCVEKHWICGAPGPGLHNQSLKRKAAPSQQRNGGVSQTHKISRPHPSRPQGKRASSPDVCGSRRDLETEGESSENSRRGAGPKWPDANEPLKTPLLSRQNVERCPPPLNQRLKERNSLHGETPRQHAAWERLRHCPHGNAIREMDENCTVPASPQDPWRNQVYVKQRWQTESSWKAVMQSEDMADSNGDARSQLLIHRKSQPLPQGTRTKDTRC